MFKSRNWTIRAVTHTTYEVEFDRAVSKEDAIWQFEANDDNILSIDDTEDPPEILEVLWAESD